MLVKDKNFKLFISQTSIQQRVYELSQRLIADYKDKKPLFITILNGAFIFAADLIRHIDIESEITFVKFTSYESTQSTGKVDQIIGFDDDIFQRHIVLIEDIVDTGLTMTEIMQELKRFRPLSLEIVTLLSKPQALQKPLIVKYIGFEIENKFVVGYGLDYDGFGRNLPDIYILEEES
jgi:hypoxanthine phosphoribosyltransferase